MINSTKVSDVLRWLVGLFTKVRVKVRYGLKINKERYGVAVPALNLKIYFYVGKKSLCVKSMKIKGYYMY